MVPMLLVATDIGGSVIVVGIVVVITAVDCKGCGCGKLFVL